MRFGFDLLSLLLRPHAAMRALFTETGASLVTEDGRPLILE